VALEIRLEWKLAGLPESLDDTLRQQISDSLNDVVDNAEEILGPTLGPYELYWDGTVTWTEEGEAERGILSLTSYPRLQGPN